ncbi:MAG: hypothetical protein ACJAXH_001925 [Colwellia sp.]|jgi:hypothetical protein
MEYLMNINLLSQANKVFFFISLLVSAPLQAAQSQKLEMNQWLKARFGAQHQALIPVVAVADMLYSCQQQKKKAEILTIKALITQLDKNTLAEQLITCLAGESPKSDTALNYGLKACFYEQLDHLSLVEKQQKMAVVIQTIATLSRSERQKSFTQCVTDQAIHYLR